MPATLALDTDQLRRHIAALQGVRHPQTAPRALERAAHYIEEALQDCSYIVRSHRFTDNGGEYRNLIAGRPGPPSSLDKLLVVAHYDTVANSPGADDNASGVAVLLELARVLAGQRLKKSVEFVAVNLEENERDCEPKGRGLRGSRALALHAREQNWTIDGVVVLESVAYAGPDAIQSAPAGLPITVPEFGDFIAVIGNQASAQLVQAFLAAAKRCQPDLPTVPLVVPGKGELFPDTRRSDHASFWDAGYPAIMLTDTTNFRSPHYHQQSDTLETLNLEFAAAVGEVAAQLLLQRAGS